MNITQLAVTAAMLGSLVAGTVLAADAPAVLTENTLQVHTYDGKDGTVKINADGTYTSQLGGKDQTGKWFGKDGKTCFQADDETAVRCADISPDLKVGGGFTTDLGDEATVVAGR